MNARLQYNFYDLSKLPLPGSTLATVMSWASYSASQEGGSEIDCPWGTSRDSFIRACRIAWRTTFRTVRDHARKKNLRSESDGKRDRAPALGRTSRDGCPGAQQKTEQAA